MGEQIAQIIGRVVENDGEHSLKPFTLHSFYGGEHMGRMLQINLPYQYDHIQLNYTRVNELIKVLTEWVANDNRTEKSNMKKVFIFSERNVTEFEQLLNEGYIIVSSTPLPATETNNKYLDGKIVYVLSK